MSSSSSPPRSTNASGAPPAADPPLSSSSSSPPGAADCAGTSSSSSSSPAAAAADTSLRFPPEEEAAMLQASDEEKAHANRLFSTAHYSDAVQAYLKALAALPAYLDYEVAVLRANLAACHLKLEDWPAAVEAATQALDALDVLDPLGKVGGGGKGKEGEGESGLVVEELDEGTAERARRFEESGRGREVVGRLRVKALLRRAKGRMEVEGWASLAGAEEDYKALRTMELTPLDRKAVETALRTLPAKLEEAKNREMADMMDKLKRLGNGILKPFGLSTDNFAFTKDPNTGGYSMQFNQNK